jgi:hypothetical protein
VDSKDHAAVIGPSCPHCPSSTTCEGQSRERKLVHGATNFALCTSPCYCDNASPSFKRPRLPDLPFINSETSLPQNSKGCRIDSGEVGKEPGTVGTHRDYGGRFEGKRTQLRRRRERKLFRRIKQPSKHKGLCGMSCEYRRAG